MMVMKGKRITSVALSAVLALVVSGCTISLGKRKPVPLEAPSAAAERTPLYRQGEWIIARGSIHNHTIYSDGCRTPEDLLELARRQGMAVLAYTDHREGKICVGRSKGLCVQAGGVEKYGYDAYYEHIGEIQETASHMGMIVIKGVEISPPVAYNRGKFPHLLIMGQFNHFVVYAVHDPEILANMPVRNSLTLKPESWPVENPYQKLVDYMNQQGGILHAVHVELDQDDWMGPVHILTPAPVRNLLLEDLTGFSILPSAWHEKTGGPGGLWDTVLLEYLAGRRERPLWASGDADYHGPHASLATSTTMFYMREFTEDEVYRCMREGRMVALQGDAFQDSYVKEWRINDKGGPESTVMLGEEVALDDDPAIRFALDRPVAGARTRLIRNGRVIAEREGSSLSYVDKELGLKREPAFYRIEVIGPRADRGLEEGATAPESELFTNPIFVRWKPQ